MDSDAAAALPRADPGEADARLVRMVAATSRYCLGTFLPRVLPPGTAVVPDEQTARPVSAAALSLAVALRCRALADGVDVAQATAAAVTAVRACVSGHVTADGGGAWGRAWQTPLVAAQLGLAAWLLDDALEAADAQAVRRVLADEARLLCELPVHYLRDVSGRLLTPGDTGAEEESWRARGLSAAVALLPDDAQADRWRRWQVLRQLAAYAAPADVARTDLLHGSPLCAWLGGSNLEPDGTLQNHHLLPQPNYMRPVHHLVAVTQQRLAGQPVSPSALHGVEALYAALRALYRGDGGVVFPAGTDVPSRTVTLYANDALHRALGLGGAEAARWERRHGELAERQLQPDGTVLEPGGLELFGPVQPDIAAKLAECLLASRLGPLRPDEVDGERPLGPPEQAVPTGCDAVLAPYADTTGELASAAAWTRARALLAGDGEDVFAPERLVDRATALVSLFRAAGAPETASAHGFPDTPSDGRELDRAVRWATAAGVVHGTVDGRLAPDAVLTRGQAVQLLWRLQGGPDAPSGPFTDVDGEVAAAAAWAWSTGVVSGRTATTLDPGAPLTRGDWARLLHRLHTPG